MEKTREIQGYGGKYRVSRDGVVVRDGRALVRIRGHYVNLSYRGVVERADIAYLVARAWVKNPTGRPWVRPKDGNWENCRAENLAWVEGKEPRKKRGGHHSKIRVGQYDKAGVLMEAYESISDAERKTGVPKMQISRACRGEVRNCHGFIWRFVE